MPSIDLNFLSLLKDNYVNYNIFIETGTNKGETIFNLEKYFNKLYTIELKENLYNLCKNKYNGNKINFICGDSIIELKNLLPTINENTIFFLDAHYMTGNSAIGIKECPLIEEIEYINTYMIKKSIVIIDDYRLFGKKSKKNKFNEQIDWTDIEKKKIINILNQRITDIYHLPSEFHKEDRLIIHLKEL